MFRAIKNLAPKIAGFGLAAQQMSVAVRDSIKIQNKLSGILASTGREFAKNTNVLNQTGVTFEQSADAVADAYMAGTRQNIRSSIKLLAQSKALGLDTKALANSMTFNRRTLGISSDNSVKLAKSFVEVGAQFGIAGDVIVRAINALKPALESAAASFGPGTATAIQSAMTTMMGTFGQGAEGALKSVMIKLTAGNAESTKLAMRLGLPLELLASNLPGDIVKATTMALSRVTELTSGFKGTPGAGLLKESLSKSLGINDAFINLGMMLNDPLERLNDNAIEQLNNQRMLTDLTQQLSVIMTPLKVDALKLLNAFVGYVDMLRGPLVATISFMSKVLAIFTALKLSQMIFHGVSLKYDKLKLAAAGRQAAGFGRTTLGRTGGVGMGGALMGAMGGPVGLGILAVSIFGPMLYSAFTAKNEKEKQRHQEAQEERKRTADALTKSSPHLAELKSLSADMRRVAMTWELFQDSSNAIGTKTNETLERIHDVSITPGKENLLNPVRPSNQGIDN